MYYLMTLVKNQSFFQLNQTYNYIQIIDIYFFINRAVLCEIHFRCQLQHGLNNMSFAVLYVFYLFGLNNIISLEAR